jgi:outer membrane autotransporter protein
MKKTHQKITPLKKKDQPLVSKLKINKGKNKSSLLDFCLKQNLKAIAIVTSAYAFSGNALASHPSACTQVFSTINNFSNLRCENITIDSSTGLAFDSHADYNWANGFNSYFVNSKIDASFEYTNTVKNMFQLIRNDGNTTETAFSEGKTIQFNDKNTTVLLSASLGSTLRSKGNFNLGNGNNIINITGDEGANNIVSSNFNSGSGDDTVYISTANAELTGTFNMGAGYDTLSVLRINTNLIAEKLVNFELVEIGDNYTPPEPDPDFPDEIPPPPPAIANVVFSGNTLQLNSVSDASKPSGLIINNRGSVSFSTNNFTIQGGVQNYGILNLRGSSPGKKLNITGSYHGMLGSEILFNTKLGNDSTLTDQLNITGNTSGTSKVYVLNAGGTGGKTTNGIPLINILGISDAEFTLGAPVQVGSYDYFLIKSGKNWVLKSSSSCSGCDESSKPKPPIKPNPVTNVTSKDTAKIYRPAVAGYLQAAQAQFDQNANVVGTLEQRQASINNTGDIWGRVIADKSSHKTSTFGYEQSSQTLQFGKDIIDIKSGTGNQTKAGVTVGLGQQSSSYSDQVRAFTSTAINTGASETTEFALGAYYTQRNEVNPYMDLQAHIIGSRTQFNDVYDGSAKQTGLGVALSAELGKDIALGNTGLDITPQAQAVYQNYSYNDFNDATSDVAKQSAQSFRVRAGITLKASKAKLAANDSNTSWSASLNVLQEVLDNPSRTVAGNVVNADNQQKPWLELGVGVNHQLNEASNLTAQISHKRSISGDQKSGNSVNVAYRLKW